MKQGLTLQAMAERVEQLSRVKQDYVIDTRQVTMLGGSELSLPVGGHGGVEFMVSEQAHRQLASRLQIPWKFYDRLRGDGNTAVKALIDSNVNTLLRENPERRMVRCYDAGWQDDGGGEPVARAFLSDRYRIRDNDQVLAHVVPILSRIPDVRFISSGLTDTHFYLKAVAPRVEGDVAVGDTVQAGVVIKNSETGHGALSVQPMVFRLICLNGMVVGEASRHYHVGRQVDSDDANRVFSDATLRLDDEAFFAKVADVVEAAVDEVSFEQIVAQLREARTGATIQKPLEAVERVAARFTLTEGEGESVLRHLIEGHDLSAYGMMNAVTRASQDVESYDRATQLEEVGGELLELAGSREWESIAA